MGSRSFGWEHASQKGQACTLGQTGRGAHLDKEKKKR